MQRAESLLQRFRALPAAGPLLGGLRDLRPGESLYLVGGTVRDLILGTAPVDIDLLVEGDLGRAVSRLGVASRVHDRFGTCTVELDGFAYDFARARRETYARPGALPEVSAASVAEDLGRRDFTVNAIALALGGAAPGTLLAPENAVQDVRARSLRVLHDQSFVDDPTRLLRLARYAARLGFTIEPHTLELAGVAVGSGALATLTGARIGAELRLLGRSTDPVAVLEQMRGLGLDEALEPGFGIGDRELARRALALLPGDGDRIALTLAAASRRLDPERLSALLARLALQAGERDRITEAALGAGPLASRLQAARRPSEVAAAVGPAGPELVALAGALGPALPARQWLQSLRRVELGIDGRDLLAAGIPAGPAIGVGLRGALAAKLDGRAVDREAELAEALRASSVNG